MRVGICGFPSSGKSTVFQALSPGASAAARGGITYGNIKVPDNRVDQLAGIFSPKKTTYAEVTFMDVGATGGGPGGAFPPDVVQAMRNADVLVHVVRAFDSPYATEDPDPARDVGRFNDELVLLDLAILEKRGERFAKEHKQGAEVDINARCVDALEDGHPLRDLGLSDDDRKTLTGIQLLSLAPLITLYNLSEDSWENSPLRANEEKGQMCICGEIEAEIAELDGEDQAEFLEGLGLGEPARNGFIRTTYAALNLISFLTSGPDECRAWTITRGMNAQRSAGRIHSDLERGFIRAEVYQLEDLLEHGSEAALKPAGKLRVEGKNYIVQDGDVMNIRFNV
jgi:GTP-binding protein YchF